MVMLETNPDHKSFVSHFTQILRICLMSFYLFFLFFPWPIIPHKWLSEQLICPLFVVVPLIIIKMSMLLRGKCKQQNQMMKELFSPHPECVTYGGGGRETKIDCKQNLLRKISHFHQLPWKITYGLNTYSKQQICF